MLGQGSVLHTICASYSALTSSVQHNQITAEPTCHTVCNADAALLRGFTRVIQELDVPVIWKLTQQDQDVLKQHNISMAKKAHVIDLAPQNDLLGSGCI